MVRQQNTLIVTSYLRLFLTIRVTDKWSYYHKLVGTKRVTPQGLVPEKVIKYGELKS